MRDSSTDTVNPGGPPAPHGARTATHPAVPLLGLARPAALLVVLVLALAGYAALAADVVNGGAFSELDAEVAEWVVESMPTWVEWLARPFTWLGGAVGITLVVAGVSVILLRRGLRREAVLSLEATSLPPRREPDSEPPSSFFPPRRRARRRLPRPRLALHVPSGRRVAALASGAGTDRVAATIADVAVTDDNKPVAEQLEELGAQLAWVRDYL